MNRAQELEAELRGIEADLEIYRREFAEISQALDVAGVKNAEWADATMERSLSLLERVEWLIESEATALNKSVAHDD